MDSANNPQAQSASSSGRKSYMLIGFVAIIVIIAIGGVAFFVARSVTRGNPASTSLQGTEGATGTSTNPANLQQTEGSNNATSNATSSQQGASTTRQENNSGALGFITQFFTQKGDPTKKPVFNNPQQVTLPIGVDDPEAVSVGFVYKFTTQLTELKTENSRTRLITTVKNPNAWFTITPDTEIVFRNADGQIRPATKDDLKPGQNIEIFTVYGLKSNLWLMQRVFILEGGQPGENL